VWILSLWVYLFLTITVGSKHSITAGVDGRKEWGWGGDMKVEEEEKKEEAGKDFKKRWGKWGKKERKRERRRGGGGGRWGGTKGREGREAKKKKWLPLYRSSGVWKHTLCTPVASLLNEESLSGAAHAHTNTMKHTHNHTRTVDCAHTHTLKDLQPSLCIITFAVQFQSPIPQLLSLMWWMRVPVTLSHTDSWTHTYTLNCSHKYCTYSITKQRDNR